MTTTEQENTSETLPPVECTGWCQDRDGHARVSDPKDQYCSSEPQRITMSRYPLIEGAAAGTRVRDYLEANLYREVDATNAHVAVDHNDFVLIELSIAEAESLAETLSALVNAARA